VKRTQRSASALDIAYVIKKPNPFSNVIGVPYVKIASLITRMRKQCAPGLLFPSPRRPGYEASTYPVLKLHAHTHEEVERLDIRPIVESLTLLILCHMSLQIMMPFTHYVLLL